jgi:N-methylhydantoinase A
VCVVLDGEVREASGREIGGRPVALPMLDIHTVGAGGGSIAWRDAGGALRVGPHSAGARPGPAAYGLGGEEPTVTDANLLLGLLGGIAGGIELDVEAAEKAVNGLGKQLGLDQRETAEGIIRVANAEMVRALRVMTVERGVDPRKLALMAFGGAGGLHAAAIADELGISKILCPRASGVLAALGLVVSERRRDAQRSVLLKAADLRDEPDELARRAREELGGDDAGVKLVAELRYRGQAFELSVPLSAGLEEDFHRAHEDAYGYRDPEAEVELVTLRATATTPGPEIDPNAVGEAAEGAERTRRDTIYGDTEIIRGEPEPGERIDGPAVVELREATLAVPPGWAGEVLESGTIRIEKQ